MPLEVSNITELSATDLAEAEDLLVGLLQQSIPSLDLNPSSVLFQLLIRPAAIFHTINQTNMDRVRNSNSLKLVTENPEEADDDALENLLSNYFIERREGSPATGQIRVILDQSKFTPIPDSMEFTSNGVIFLPSRSFTGVPTEDDVLTGDERVIEALDDGKFAFLIDVEATSSGQAGNLPSGSTFTFTSPLSHVTSAVAAGDFDGGDDEETNEELIERAATGITARSLGNRSAISSLYSEAFPSVKDLSIIGAGDPEMRRDQHNLLGISSFGKADIYVRTRRALVTWTDTKSATLQSVSVTGLGTWLMTFTRSEVPAAYTVFSIKEATDVASDGSLDIITIQRSVDLAAVAGVDINPDMTDNEHVFTRYQTMFVTFQTTEETAAAGDTRDFTVSALYQPEVDTISDYTLNRAHRHPAGDYLVKASIPCLVAVGATLVLGPGEETPDLDAIKQSVTDAVNGVDFLTGRMSADVVIEAISPHLGSRTRVQLPLDLRGRIITPVAEISPQVLDDDGDIWLFSSKELVIPDYPELMLSSRTVSFFTTPESVEISVLPSDHIAV